MTEVESFCPEDQEKARELITRLAELEPKPPRKKRLPKQGQETWVSLRSIFGTAKVPEAVGEIVTLAIEKMMAAGDIGPGNKFQLLEYLCADYLSSLGEHIVLSEEKKLRNGLEPV